MFKNLSTGAIGIRADMREGLDLAKNAGFEGLDLNIDEANQIAQEYSVQYVKDLWSDAGIAMGGWGFGVNWRGPDADYYAGLAQLPNVQHSLRNSVVTGRPRLSVPPQTI